MPGMFQTLVFFWGETLPTPVRFEDRQNGKVPRCQLSQSKPCQFGIFFDLGSSGVKPLGVGSGNGIGSKLGSKYPYHQPSFNFSTHLQPNPIS